MAATSVFATAQQPAPTQVKVHVLNACTPSREEPKEIAATLAKLLKLPIFTPDFEVARWRLALWDDNVIRDGGNASMSGQPATATGVRMRRDFSHASVFSNVQYSFSTGSEDMIGTPVLDVRDPHDSAQLSLEDSAVGMTSAAAIVGSATLRVTRIRLERFEKPSVARARGMASESGRLPDQSAYEQLFRDASSVMDRYHTLLQARQTVPEELAKVASASGKSETSPQPATRRTGRS
jgi:hypothetical protein